MAVAVVCADKCRTSATERDGSQRIVDTVAFGVEAQSSQRPSQPVCDGAPPTPDHQASWPEVRRDCCGIATPAMALIVPPPRMASGQRGPMQPILRSGERDELAIRQSDFGPGVVVAANGGNKRVEGIVATVHLQHDQDSLGDGQASRGRSNRLGHCGRGRRDRGTGGGRRRTNCGGGGLQTVAQECSPCTTSGDSGAGGTTEKGAARDRHHRLLGDQQVRRSKRECKRPSPGRADTDGLRSSRAVIVASRSRRTHEQVGQPGPVAGLSRRKRRSLVGRRSSNIDCRRSGRSGRRRQPRRRAG